MQLYARYLDPHKYLVRISYSYSQIRDVKKKGSDSFKQDKAFLKNN